MLAEPEQATSSSHEADLQPQDGYSAWKERVILQSLVDDQIAVDFGAGNQLLDDPCIIRLDILLHPHVDVVADLHALPFLPNSIDFIFGGAVVEHLRQPFVAATEMYRVLKAGGYVYADCSFVFGYHGYPAHYFNMSMEGLREVFHQFRQLDAGVAPFQKPSFALESVFQTYLEHFVPDGEDDVEFVGKMHELLQYPLRVLDGKFPPEHVHRVSAGSYFVGVKQPAGGETILPGVVMDAWRHSEKLKSRFPVPENLCAPDNLMQWAQREGREESGEIDEYFRSIRPFAKSTGSSQASDRSALRGTPVALLDRPGGGPIDEARETYAEERRRIRAVMRRRTRPFRRKIADAWSEGAWHFVRMACRHLRWWVSERHGRTTGDENGAE